MAAVSNFSDVPRKVIEKCVDPTVQRLEAWRCVMAITMGLCLVSWTVAGLALILPTGRHKPELLIAATLFLIVVWGVSQLWTAISVLGVVGIALFCTEVMAFVLLPTAALDQMAYAVGAVILFAPLLFLTVRAVCSPPADRTTITLSKNRTFGLMAALQAVLGMHPICMHLPSRIRRTVSIGLFGLSQWVVGVSICIALAGTTAFTLNLAQILERVLSDLSSQTMYFDLGELTAVLVRIPFWLGAILAIAAALRSVARRFSRTSLELMIRDDPRAPLLFLRSFRDDQVRLGRPKRNLLTRLVLLGEPSPTLDHILLEEGTSRGPVIAIGAPDSTPPFGAARTYVSDDTWKQVVADLARRAQLIVMALDETVGIEWELNEVHGNSYTSKVLHLLPPRLAPADTTRRFAEHVHKALPEISNVIVDLRNFLETNQRACIGWYEGPSQKLIVLTTTEPSEASYRIAVRNFVRSIRVDTSEPQEILRLKELGSAAFTLTLANSLFILLIMITAGIAHHLGKANGYFNFGIGNAVIFFLLLDAVAVVMAVVALWDSTAKKTQPIWAIAIGCLTLLLSGTAVLIGMKAAG